MDGTVHAATHGKLETQAVWTDEVEIREAAMVRELVMPLEVL